MKKIFETIPEGKLPSRRDEIDHEIILKIEKIKSSSLIPIKLEEQEIIKEYLNEIMKRKDQSQQITHNRISILDIQIRNRQKTTRNRL